MTLLFLNSTAGLLVNLLLIFTKKSAIEELLQKAFKIDKLITLEHRKQQKKQLSFQSRGINEDKLKHGLGNYNFVGCASQDQTLSGKISTYKDNLKISNVDRLVILRDNYTLSCSGSLSTNEISNVESCENEEVNFNGFNLPSLSWIETMTLKPTLLAIDPTWKICLTVSSRIITTAGQVFCINLMFLPVEEISTVRFIMKMVSHTYANIYIFAYK